MKRIHNFSAGPAALPLAVLEQIQAEWLDYHGSGMALMEMSHRGHRFMDVASRCEAAIRDVLGVPDDYYVLFLQGGATAQFGVVPQNLLGANRTASFVVTGSWSQKAFKDFAGFGQAHLAASTEAQAFRSLPALTDWSLQPGSAYLHLCGNETIHGVEFAEDPPVLPLPVVADLSSNIASRPIDVRRYGVIYAGAQKNLGPSGLTLVIVRKDLCRDVLPGTLSINDYRVMAASESMLNTPPTFAWYAIGLVFQWIRDQGGLAEMARRNAAKAALLYGYLDSQDFYRNPVTPAARSRMNVPFLLSDPSLDKAFVAESEAAGFEGLKGHRSVGGMRASLYNAVTLADVEALVAFMKDFVQRRA